MTAKTYLEAKAQEVELMRGKRGVAQARKRLAKLREAHERIKANLNQGNSPFPVMTPQERRLARLSRFLHYYRLTEDDLTNGQVEQLLEQRHHDRVAAQLGISRYADYSREAGDFVPRNPAYLVPLMDLDPKKSHYARLGEWFITLVYDEEVDWHYYSRSYRFPKVTISNRRVVVARRVNKYRVNRHEVPVESWRGNVVLKALVELGIAREHKYTGLLRAAQGHPAFALVHRRSLGSRYDLYQRTLGGHHIDYVLVDREAGVAQHGSGLKEAMRELQKKLEALGMVRVEGDSVTYDFLKSLGFCTSGIKEFCRETGLRYDTRATYSLHYVLDKYNELPRHRREVYRREVEILQRAFS